MLLDNKNSRQLVWRNDSRSLVIVIPKSRSISERPLNRLKDFPWEITKSIIKYVHVILTWERFASLHDDREAWIGKEIGQMTFSLNHFLQLDNKSDSTARMVFSRYAVSRRKLSYTLFKVWDTSTCSFNEQEHVYICRKKPLVHTIGYFRWLQTHWQRRTPDSKLFVDQSIYSFYTRRTFTLVNGF